MPVTDGPPHHRLAPCFSTSRISSASSASVLRGSGGGKQAGTRGAQGAHRRTWWGGGRGEDLKARGAGGASVVPSHKRAHRPPRTMLCACGRRQPRPPLRRSPRHLPLRPTPPARDPPRHARPRRVGLAPRASGRGISRSGLAPPRSEGPQKCDSSVFTGLQARKTPKERGPARRNLLNDVIQKN